MCVSCRAAPVEVFLYVYMFVLSLLFIKAVPSFGTIATLDDFMLARMCVSSRNFGGKYIIIIYNNIH